MTSRKNKIAVVLGTAALMTGAITALQPPSDNVGERARNQLNKDVENLADSHGREVDRYRDAGDAQREAENGRKLIPGEHRPPEPHGRIRTSVTTPRVPAGSLP